MHALFADLLALLQLEVEHYRKLLLLLRRERGRIVRGELADLVDVVRRKEAVTRDLSALQVRRAAILSQLARQGGTPGGEVSLDQAVALAPRQSAEPLRSLVTEFRNIIGRLVAANEVNRTLLGRSLDLVNGSLDTFRTLAGSGSTYGAEGRLQPVPAQAVNRTA
ncbi:MAG: flagellar protein FlgN [Candidatus Methylomirabilales bacterium]